MSITEIKQPISLPKWRALLQLCVVLFKLRVVSLLVTTAVGGAFLGAGGWPGLDKLLLVIVTGTMAAAGASAINQYWERERDKTMRRTRKRPLPSGTIDQQWVPLVGLALIVLPVAATAPFNGWLAFWLAAGAFIYVVVYTIWLKPRTLLNIVIGGAAGSAAVMSGGAAVGAAFDKGVIVLALVLFLWTPCHFWSLAMMYRDDYSNADVPMLPTLVSPRQSGWWVLSHGLPTIIGCVLLLLLPSLGLVYAVPVLWFSADLLRRNIRLIQEPTTENAKRYFIGSNIYLAVVMSMIFASTSLTALSVWL